MATSRERAKASQLRRKGAKRTPAEDAWLSAYEANRGKPGRPPSSPPPPPVFDAEPVIETPPPAADAPSSPPPPAGEGAPSSSGGAPPIAVDPTVGAAPGAEPPPEGLPEPSPEAMQMATMVVAVIRANDQVIGAAYGVSIDGLAVEVDGKPIGLGLVVWPAFTRCWAIALDEWGIANRVKEALTKETAQAVAIGSGLYGLGGGMLARRKLARDEAERKKAAPPAPTEKQAAQPAQAAPQRVPFALVRSSAPSSGDDEGFRPRAGGAPEEKR